MAGNKAPRKKQTVVRIDVPMQKSMRDDIALELRLAVKALIYAPSIEAAEQLASFLLTITTAINATGQRRGKSYVLDRADRDAMALRAALETLATVEARFNRVGKYGLSDDEAETLQAASAGLDSALARVPYNVFQEACRVVRQQFPTQAELKAA